MTISILNFNISLEKRKYFYKIVYYLKILIYQLNSHKFSFLIKKKRSNYSNYFIYSNKSIVYILKNELVY